MGIGLGAPANDIGGNRAAGEANIIVSNQTGILVGDEGAVDNVISGNYIGTNSDLETGLGNSADGIAFLFNTPSTVGGASFEQEGNVIAFNGANGVSLLGRGGSSPLLGVAIVANSIFDNRGLGIDLGGNGITPNDFGDTDRGPNNLQNYPELRIAARSEVSTIIQGRLNARPGREFLLELFISVTCPSDPFGQGQLPVDQVLLEAPTRGFRLIDVEVDPLPLGTFVTGTLSDLDTQATSEFSECVLVRQDTDGDSVPDDLEPADVNQDGIPDSQQPNVAGSGEITLVLPEDAKVQSVFQADVEESPDGTLLPAGVLNLSIELPNEDAVPGSAASLPSSPARSTTVTLHVAEDLEVDSYYNFGPTPEDPSPHWYEFLFDGTTGARILDDVIELHFVDGQRGDHDLEVNGQIETLGGPVTLGVLLFPLFRSGQEDFTGIAVSNLAQQSANLRFSAYGPDGLLLPLAQNPSVRELAAGRQLARLGNEIFDEQASTDRRGWIELKSDGTRTGSFFQFGDVSLTRLDGSAALTRQGRNLYFPRIFQGPTSFRGESALTSIGLANPNRSAVSVVLSLFTPDESAEDATQMRVQARVERNLPPKGALFESLSDLFGPSLMLAAGYLVAEVQEGPGIVGFQLIELPERSTVVGLSASFGNSGTGLFSAQLATLPGGLFTNVNFINTNAEARTLTLTGFAEDGSRLADPAVWELAPGGQLSEDAASLFASPSAASQGKEAPGGESGFIGSLQVDADGPGVIGDVIFGDPASFRFAAALPLQTNSFREAVFNQVANVPGFFTGLALFAPEEDANITIEVRDAAGMLVGQSIQSLQAGQRLSKLVPELAPASAGQAGGYIVVRSTAALIAQQLFGALGPDGVRLLSAVPPTILDQPDGNP